MSKYETATTITDEDRIPDDQTGEGSGTGPDTPEGGERVDGTPQPDAGARPQPWHRRGWLQAAAAGLALALVLGGADVILTLRADRAAATDQARSQALAAGDEAVPAVLSYDYTSISGYPAQAEAKTTGDFKKSLTDLINQAVLPAAAANQIVTRSTVSASSVVTADPATVVLLMFINQQTTTKSQATPLIQGSRLRVTMRRVGGNWLISQLQPV